MKTPNFLELGVLFFFTLFGNSCCPCKFACTADRHVWINPQVTDLGWA